MLDSELVKVQKELAVIDTIQLQKTNAEMAEKLGYIQVNLEDTVDLKLAQTLDTYNSLRIELIAILRQYHELTGSIEAEKQQIATLKHDLQHNLTVKEKVIDYCKAEQSVVEMIKTSVATILQVKEEKVKKYETIKSSIEEEVQKIKKCETCPQ